MKFDLILQGPVYPETNQIVSNYLSLNFVNNIIISCWEDSKDLNIKSDKIIILRNKDVDYPGIGNINRQLKSSLAGLKLSQLEYCAKMRTDQIISISSMEMMYKFFDKLKDEKVNYEDGNGPKHSIFVLGMYTRFPFHPRDHVFWGHKKDLLNLFDIPYCDFIDPGSTRDDLYWSKVIRPECYIGMYYYSKFDSRIKKFILNYKDYILDNGILKPEAMSIYNELRDKVFKVFPRIDMSWPKHGLSSYHYHVGERYSEYWFEGKW